MGRKNARNTGSDSKAATSAPKHNPHAQLPKSFEAMKTTIEAELAAGSKQTVNQKNERKTIVGSEASDYKPSTVNGTKRGKKRDRDGQILAGAPKEDTKQAGGDFFLTEVMALGGTSEDIDLLADAQSDSELEGTALTESVSKGIKQNNGLEKGISNILKEISLAQGNVELSDQSSDDSVESSGNEDTAQRLNGVQPISKSGLRCEVRPDWFRPTDAFDYSAASNAKISADSLAQMQDFAHSLLVQENDLYQQKNQSGSSRSFYNTVIASGTLSDKISALTLAVQESPIHNKKALETLFGLSKKRSRSQAVDVLRALKDLMAQGALLPGSRRLYTFASQPALLKAFGSSKSWTPEDKLPKGITEQYLIIWSFESWLKDQYFEMLQTLEVWCNDELEFAKSRSLSYVFELLKEKPEQESNLLRLLINKLGDPVKKIASQASYLVMQLLTAHPAMKRIVVSAIESDFIFRPGQSLHGKYYATVTLNQTTLSANEEDIAQKLLGIYFSLFSALLKADQSSKVESGSAPLSRSRSQRQRQKGKKPFESGQAQTDELQQKLTSALLTGVNRAYPYADAEHKNFEEQLDTLFKIAHSANFNTSVQAMLLIQQLSAPHQASTDRFYRLLYESLLDPRLITASKQQLYLNLLHRSLKGDLSARRAKAFVKRILQTLSLHEPSFICGAFFLLKDLESALPGLTSLTDQAEELEANEEIFDDIDDLNRPVNGTLRPTNGSLGRYDGHKRAPEHANADHSCAWELLPFLAHFHPSVSVSAEYYMRHVKLPGTPDLTLHTLIHFLDRFVYRNAKLSESKMRGSSIMQPLASDNTKAVLFNPTNDEGRLPVNSDAFRSKKTVDVAAEDVFFHQYFSETSKESKKNKKQKKTEEQDVGSDDESEVWKAMLNTAPDLEGEEDGGEDDDMSDFEAAMDDKSPEGLSDAEISDEGVDVEDGFFDDSDEEDMDPWGGPDEDAEFMQLNADTDDSVEEASTTLDTGPRSVDKIQPTKERRKKLRALPTFASADDYAQMLEDGEDEDFGI